jgi:SAM-dependent methyltransferase
MEQIINYWNERPCNIRHSSCEVGTAEYFEQVEKRKYFVESHIPGFAEFHKWTGKRVLEIGCGIGTDAVNFARNGAEYTGIELSDTSLELAKQRFELFKLKGQFFNIDAQNYDKLSAAVCGGGGGDGGGFDLVYSFGVIHHSPDPQKIIDNCLQLLKPDGVLKIMVYAENSWKKIMIDRGLDQYEAQSNCPVAFTYTNDQIYKMLTHFRNVQIRQEHIFPYKIPEYKQYKYIKEDWFGQMPDNVFEALEAKLGWHLCITCQK